MEELPKGLSKEIDALLKKYKVNKLSKADILGQAVLELKDNCIGVDFPWLTGGMLYRYVRKNKAVETLKKLSDLLIAKQKDAHINYNDMDCDLYATHLITPILCLTCCAFVSSLDKNKPETKDCPRCKGTGKDPEFNEESWIIRYENHGYTTFYIIHETCLRIELHIRELPYNSPKSDILKAFVGICAGIPKDCYDTNCKFIRYRDSRDEGFVLSMEYDKPDRLSRGLPITHKCELINARSVYAVDTIVEHFVCVIDGLEKGEEQ